MRISRTASVLMAAFLGGENSDENSLQILPLKKYYQHNKKLTLQAKPKREATNRCTDKH